MRVLVVDDDARLRRALKRGLELEGFAVDVAADGDEGAWFAAENAYDVVVLDVMLPGRSGLDLCASLREADDWTPVLMLTARSDHDDVARALDLGADDYLAKPFSYVVLLARIRALLRRGGQRRPAVLTVGDLSLDPARHVVRRGGDVVELTPRQFSLLEYLMRRGGEVVPKSDILEHVWDFDFEGDPNIVEVYVRHLRNKVDRPFDRASIETLRGAGYQVVDEDEA